MYSVFNMPEKRERYLHIVYNAKARHTFVIGWIGLDVRTFGS